METSLDFRGLERRSRLIKRKDILTVDVEEDKFILIGVLC